MSAIMFIELFQLLQLFPTCQSFYRPDVAFLSR